MGYIENIRKKIGHDPIILCGSVVIIENNKGQILLEERSWPEGVWCLPGGLLEMGESTEEAVRREVKEETGLNVDGLNLFGVYSGRDYFCEAKNGDQWYVVVTVYTSADYSGEMRISDSESVRLQWTDIDRIPEKFGHSQKKAVQDYINMRQKANGLPK